ncbi:SH3 domain-containing protein [Streptomyces sp. NPDC058653]|uniref:SH3 domain-containing protein n=1 Tax=Streptomyces sp. NPDC058653 TaxID=3346576 RepID=UPI00365FE953
MSQRSLRSSRARRSARPQRLRGSFGPYAAALAVAMAALTATPAMAALPAPPPVSSNGHADMDDPAAMADQAAMDQAAMDEAFMDPAVQERPATLDPEVAQAAEASRAEAAEAAAAGDEAAAAHFYKGRVTARSGLLIRDRPTRSSRVVGSLPYGTLILIHCKTRGDSVNGNNHWYLLADGTWAWVSAAYIENIGKTPRWC